MAQPGMMRRAGPFIYCCSLSQSLTPFYLLGCSLDILGFGVSPMALASETLHNAIVGVVIYVCICRPPYTAHAYHTSTGFGGEAVEAGRREEKAG